MKARLFLRPSDRAPATDSAGTCQNGCCEWEDEGKVVRYASHLIGRCEHCGDPITREADAQYDDSGRLFDSDKCERKFHYYNEPEDD